ncbi:hypothetical protein F4801DRAFT_352326 [Xylaria longipes]|nr:hypothetical protein F4801DRAFT_352326 [Xylaria longipes]
MIHFNQDSSLFFRIRWGKGIEATFDSFFWGGFDVLYTSCSSRARRHMLPSSRRHPAIRPEAPPRSRLGARQRRLRHHAEMILRGHGRPESGIPQLPDNSAVAVPDPPRCRAQAIQQRHLGPWAGRSGGEDGRRCLMGGWGDLVDQYPDVGLMVINRRLFVTPAPSDFSAGSINTYCTMSTIYAGLYPGCVAWNFTGIVTTKIVFSVLKPQWVGR